MRLLVLVLLAISISSASATTYLVRPDGTGDFPTIQAAINAAAEGDTIELADGTFAGEGNRDVDFLGKAIVVRSLSRDPAICTIDCQYLGRGVLFQSGETSQSILEGVTVRNGYVIHLGFGGGIYCEGAAPTLRACWLVDNVAGDLGGGLYATQTHLVIEGCTFSGNRSLGAGGGICLDHASATLTSCEFVSNCALGNSGGALCIYSAGDTLTMDSCHLSGNSAGHGGGIYSRGLGRLEEVTFLENAAHKAGALCWEAGNIEISDCEFRANTAISDAGACQLGEAALLTETSFWSNRAGGTGGALFLLSCPAWIETCTLARNRASSGGGIFCGLGSEDASVVGCTFYADSASAGSALYIESSYPFLRNSIIACGSGCAIWCSGVSVPTVTCCDVFGNAGGDWTGCIANQYDLAGNISLDPWFCDAESGDLHLCADSPCAPFSPPNAECDLIGAFGVGCAPMGLAAGSEEMGVGLWLSPNPIVGAAQIRYLLPPGAGLVKLGIYDLAGRLVRSFEGGAEATGSLAWDGTDASGHPVWAGAYFLRLRMRKGEVTRQVMVLR